MSDLTKYLPIVAWETFIKNVEMLTIEDIDNPSTYRITVEPSDFSQPGTDVAIEIGFCIEDFAGNVYPVIAVASYVIDVIDIFRCGYGPVTNKIGIVYKPVGKISSLFIAPIDYGRLDKSALNKQRARELSAFWMNDPNPYRITFSSTDSPAITDYQGFYAEDYGENPKVRLMEEYESGKFRQRTELPNIELTDGLISNINFGVLDIAIVGYIEISR